MENELAVAVMGGHTNYLDVHRELHRLGLTARHVIRPAYRDSLRWLKYHLINKTLNNLLPLLFVCDAGKTILARNEEDVARALKRLGLPV